MASSQAYSEKTPPPFNRACDDYAKWKKKFLLWQAITDVPKAKQGGLMVLRLDDDTQDAILELMTNTQLKEENGAETMLTHLDTFLKKR